MSFPGTSTCESQSWPPYGHPAFQSRPPAGGDSQRPSAELLLWAYGHGVFPMADPSGPSSRIDWYCPDPRGILPLQPPEAFHVSKNMAREVRRARFEIRSDTVFEQVIRACATSRADDNPSWLNEDLIASYIALHQLGHAHSVEAWREGQLVGGLYGVHIGSAFFGESMFSRPWNGGANSSKVCLVHLVRSLRSRGFSLLDTQFWNPHLDQFGCVEISADEYLAMLNDAIRRPASWGEFDQLGPAQC
jgi:leucyl/phenylalanyl-tRNA--protein transferase